MRLNILVAIIAMISSQTGVSQSEVDSTRILRVLSFNILHGETMKEDYDLDVIAKVIIDAKPDIVALARGRL